MILYHLVGSEDHPAYTRLAASSLQRQYDFLTSIITTALDLPWPKVSSALIRALNHHAIACLHVHAGEYRPCEVEVGDHQPPPHYLVPELMNEMINDLNRHWDSVPPIVLGGYALWRLNWIHPFINGNGRTARALCYYVFCLRAGGFPPGMRPLPVLIRENREDYLEALQEADRGQLDGDEGFLNPVISFLARIMSQS